MTKLDLPPLPLSLPTSSACIIAAYKDPLVFVMDRTAARTYPPSTLLLGEPVSAANITPTLNLAVPSALTDKLLNVETSAATSAVNFVTEPAVWLQFAVLSITNNTFGMSPEVLLEVSTNKS